MIISWGRGEQSWKNYTEKERKSIQADLLVFPSGQIFNCCIKCHHLIAKSTINENGDNLRYGLNPDLTPIVTHLHIFACMRVQCTCTNFFQLCQWPKEDMHYERHHDDNVAKTANIVDGNIQAG